MGKHVERDNPGGGSSASQPPRVLAEFQLDAAHCLVVPATAETTVADDRAIGEVRLGDTCYSVIRRPPPQVREVAPGAGDPTELLTAREQQIVRLVCFGQVNKQIAHRLNISEYTVKTYLKQVFMKLNVHSRAAMVYRCARWVGATAGERPPGPGNG